MSRLRDLLARVPKTGPALPDWLERLLAKGIVTADPNTARRQRIVNVAAFAAAANALSHLVINALYDFAGLAIVNVYNLLFAALALSVPRLHRHGDNVGAIVLVLAILAGNLFVVFALGVASDLHIYFTLAGAMLFFFGVENWKLFLGFFVLAAATLLFALNFAPVDGFVIPYDGTLRDMLSSHAMINTIIINAAMIFYALTALRRAELELAAQHARSEALIETVMPTAIASRLKAGEERIADRIEMLSVLFADLAGFTAAARDRPPEQVVAYLDDLVRRFDALCAEHGVEKIKTIGDCYMAAAGFTDGRDGAVAVGRLALAMQAAMANTPPLGTERLELRIGIGCGPATAGVIGDTRFTYDVWGDAVNVASRMESHGEPGRILVTESFAALTAGAFTFAPRGEIALKGLGTTRPLFLVGPRGDTAATS